MANAYYAIPSQIQLLIFFLNLFFTLKIILINTKPIVNLNSKSLSKKLLQTVIYNIKKNYKKYKYQLSNLLKIVSRYITLWLKLS